MEPTLHLSRVGVGWNAPASAERSDALAQRPTTERTQESATRRASKATLDAAARLARSSRRIDVAINALRDLDDMMSGAERAMQRNAKLANASAADDRMLQAVEHAAKDLVVHAKSEGEAVFDRPASPAERAHRRGLNAYAQQAQAVRAAKGEVDPPQVRHALKQASEGLFGEDGVVSSIRTALSSPDSRGRYESLGAAREKLGTHIERLMEAQGQYVEAPLSAMRSGHAQTQSVDLIA